MENFLQSFSGSGEYVLRLLVAMILGGIIGLERQVGVLAFQFGDGFGNMMIPTSAVLMGVLGAARVSWISWIRWVWPLVVVLHLIGAALLLVVGAVALWPEAPAPDPQTPPGQAWMNPPQAAPPLPNT